MTEDSTSSNAPQVRQVVIHMPGPAWQYGTDFREQPGVQAHVAHYRQLHEDGKLELGGPFLLPDSGGMMIATIDVTRDEIESFAAADPAVQSGLLRFEIRPWYTAMARTDRAS
jgi:uncharacterized protein YciI